MRTEHTLPLYLQRGQLKRLPVCYLANHAISGKGSFLKTKEFVVLGSKKFFPFRTDTFSEWWQNFLKQCLPLSVYVPLKTE